MINLILFGPPGSGKGTQAAKLVEHYHFTHISTGDLFRYEMSNDTPLGQKAKAYMAEGQLVPDEITIGMLRNKVESIGETFGFIFDGFPRTVAQAEALDQLLAEKGQTITGLISLTVEDEEIVKRILLRGETSGRPDDNDENIIRRRIEVYKEETTPVAEYYAQVDKTYQIPGMGSIDQIFDNLTETIDALLDNPA
jgi:adenylate kinase